MTEQDVLALIYRTLDGYSQRIKTSGNIVMNGSARLMLVNLSADPANGSVGDLICVGGKLKICTVGSLTVATWTIVGTQT